MFGNAFYISKVFFASLFYNHFCNLDYILDACMTPLFWFVDNYVSVFGSAFVTLCGWLMLSIIWISYWIGLPYWWEKTPSFTIILLIVGNWLMINCVFHFYMGITCDPGHPIVNKDFVIKEASGLCKKCIAPKPQRTHHCSICKMCILLMDHHCPWLNNCVGHFNRRYFFFYIVYIIAAILFLVVFGVEIAYKEIWLPTSELDGFPVSTLCAENKDSCEDLNEKQTKSEYSSRQRAIIFVALISIGTLIALGYLLIRHIGLITRGETTVEMYINASETKRLAERGYRNPYNFGSYKNWTIFLGIYNGSGRNWMHILFPSTHKPFGDGFYWPNIYTPESEWNEFFHPKY